MLTVGVAVTEASSGGKAGPACLERSKAGGLVRNDEVDALESLHLQARLECSLNCAFGLQTFSSAPVDIYCPSATLAQSAASVALVQIL